MTSGTEYIKVTTEAEQRMRDKAIEAAKIVIDKFYDSGFDPRIDYLGLFKSLL